MKRPVLPPFLSTTRRRRGMTVIEMYMASAISVLIAIAVAWTILAAAQSTNEGLSYIQSESRARIAADSIRRFTLVGQFRSAVVSNGGRTVQFRDPLRNTTSEFAFANGTLSFTPNTATPTASVRRWQGLSDVTFELQASGNFLAFNVSAVGLSRRNASTTVTVRDRILLRNVP